LNNNIFKRHLSSSYDTHAKRFVESAKHFYDIDMTLDEYDELCQTNASNYKLRKVYSLNGRAMVATIILKGKTIYVIFGGTYNDRAIPPYKTTLPDLYDEKTLLPVPQKLLLSGLDRVEFSKKVRQTIISKTEYYINLSNDMAYLTNERLVASTDISQIDKIQLLRLRKPKTVRVYDINDAIRDIAEEYRRSRSFQGPTPEAHDGDN